MNKAILDLINVPYGALRTSDSVPVDETTLELIKIPHSSLLLKESLRSCERGNPGAHKNATLCA